MRDLLSKEVERQLYEIIIAKAIIAPNCQNLVNSRTLAADDVTESGMRNVLLKRHFISFNRI